MKLIFRTQQLLPIFHCLQKLPGVLVDKNTLGVFKSERTLIRLEDQSIHWSMDKSTSSLAPENHEFLACQLGRFLVARLSQIFERPLFDLNSALNGFKRISLHDNMRLLTTMEESISQEPDPDIQAQLVLLAASHHDLESLRTLLRTGSASVQDPETGFTPLHAAIAACDAIASPSSEAQNGTVDEVHDSPHVPAHDGALNGDTTESDLVKAANTVKLLLQNGAIWNDVDSNNETPGCLALRLGLKDLYDIMVDAGVRAEMLLNRLDEYEQIKDNDDDDDDDTEEEDGDVEEQTDTDHVEAHGSQHLPDNVDGQTQISRPSLPASAIENDLQNENYLQSSLHFQDGRILDDSNNGVMMAWEMDIMKRTAERLAPKSGLRILNIGHGMGIIDSFFQEREPSSHYIIEAHPAVVERMKKDGWDVKSGINILEGRWQNVVPKIMESGTLFDAIYFDTFAEDYKALRDFFSDCLIGLLDDGGKWGFFNGLGADRQICYDVYGKVVEMDLFEAGFDTVWENVKILPMEKDEWEGIKRRYWALQEYKLPICEFIG